MAAETVGTMKLHLPAWGNTRTELLPAEMT
jgi:hypothetical protein